MFKKFIFKFPFLKEKAQTATIVPKLLLATALIKPSLLSPPSILIDSFYKSAIALSVRPFKVGSSIKIDKYEGVVKNINFWYLTLERSKGYVFIPTSHVYNTVIELNK